MFMAARSRLASTLASTLGPSTPKFAEWFVFEPSMLFSPLASLCLTAYRVRSVSVNPS